jgi:Zn-dependent peptidase ImmA (M78 family)
MPVKGLMSASQPSSSGGDILIDSTLPRSERRVALLHELKHLIDGGHTTELQASRDHDVVCTDFALGILIPASWLRADWQAGHHNVRELAERYEVPEDAMYRRLDMFGLRRDGPSSRHRAYCQWQPITAPYVGADIE